MRVVRVGPAAVRVDLRTLALAGAVLIALVLLAGWAMTLGSFRVPTDEIVRSILGRGQPQFNFIVLSLRLPRVLAAVTIGALLASSGAIFQGLVRNPLVAPDLIGINAGAGLAAVAWIVTRQEHAFLPAVAFVGAVVAATAIYFLSHFGRLGGSRLVLVGVGINAMLTAATTFLIVRFPIEQVSSAVLWTAGTVYGADWRDVAVLAIAAAVLLPLAICVTWPLRVLQLGDTTAHTLGLPLDRTRLGQVAVGCALAATAVSIGGGIGFVAFMVPHVGRMLAGPMTGGTMLLTALLGALLLLGADVVAQHAFPVGLPVGVVTAALGAPYFLYLLCRGGARL